MTMWNASQGEGVRETTLGLRVVKSLGCAADGNIFTTYGRVLIKLLIGQATAAEATGATTIQLQEERNTVNLCAATTVTGDAIGTMYRLTGDPAVILCGTGNVPVIDASGLLSAVQHADMIIGRELTTDAIQLVETGNSATLVISWMCFYVPLDEGAYVVAA